MAFIKQKRIFFALWPDDNTRQEIYQLFLDSGLSKTGHLFKSHNLHLTLHFLGNVPAEKYDCALEVASAIKVNAFNLKLDHYGVFKKAGILWYGPTCIPQGLSELHHKLAVALGSCDYLPDKRKLKPHVTLMRKYKAFDQQFNAKEINWFIDQFALVESIPVEGGVEYKPVKIYKLT